MRRGVKAFDREVMYYGLMWFDVVVLCCVVFFCFVLFG